MKALRYWLFAIVTDAILAGLFYVGKVDGVSQAIDVAVFWLWVVSILKLIIAFVVKKETVDKMPRPAGFDYYHATTEVLTISALVWFGFFWLAAVYLIAVIFWESAIASARKENEKEKPSVTEDDLERMYWEFDAARFKSRDERLRFKEQLRGLVRRLGHEVAQ